ncbi:hypothetical protein HDU87_004041 [Geranomyces variabilis]|uniref:DUF159-domain-containing protein n=1 Tax=Geranomyces variabilis TaxID=109894 RepID=A0AAD5TT64_9FUNG|nr:hypothetical protein HDU87_004041 [Geranomyces variabilis]
MCGRTALALDADEIQFRVGASQWVNASAYRPSHNVAPTRHQPVLRQVSDNSSGSSSGGGGTSASVPAVSEHTSGNRILHSMKWGVIPSWQKKTPDYKSSLQTINARDDRVADSKSMWSKLKHSKRCVVIAEGFFEWLKKGSERQPFYLYRENGRLLTFAGLYDTAMVDGTEVWSYTIITTSSSKATSWLHDRMPVILDSEEDVALWLDPAKKFTDDVSALMRPLESGLKWHPVSKFVSKVGNDEPQCILPVTLPAEFGGKGSIRSFFKPASNTSTPTPKSRPSASPRKPAETPHPGKSKPHAPPKQRGAIESAFLRTPKVKPDDAPRVVAGEAKQDGDDDARFEEDLALAIKRSRDETDDVKREEEKEMVDESGPSHSKRRRGPD